MCSYNFVIIVIDRSCLITLERDHILLEFLLRGLINQNFLYLALLLWLAQSTRWVLELKESLRDDNGVASSGNPTLNIA